MFSEKKEKQPAPKKAPGKQATKVEQERADGKWHSDCCNRMQEIKC